MSLPSNICSSLNQNSKLCFLSNTSISDKKEEKSNNAMLLGKKVRYSSGTYRILILKEGRHKQYFLTRGKESTSRLGLYVLQENLKIRLI